MISESWHTSGPESWFLPYSSPLIWLKRILSVVEMSPKIAEQFLPSLFVQEPMKIFGHFFVLEDHFLHAYPLLTCLM